MKIIVIGAGPAGLSFAAAIGRARPDASVTVIGFGVVFSDKALDFLQVDARVLHAALMPHLESWQDLNLVHKGETVTIDGVGFFAIARLTLLDILSREAAAAGA